ncbi:hypothetical protein HORM4_790119 [Vibrio harveyi]|nr:hypothetical protein HORM4_790119 [Vibrio harveyi]
MLFLISTKCQVCRLNISKLTYHGYTYLVQINKSISSSLIEQQSV